MKAKTLFLTAALASLSPALAEQEVYFPERTRVAVSAEDLNVLLAENGEVVSAIANESELHLLRQGGRLYFRVLALGKTVPLFAEIRFGEGDPVLYTLLLDPLADLPAERIVVRGPPSEAAEPHAQPALVSGARTREIKSLLLAMARGWDPDGYRVQVSAGLIVSEGDVRRELLRSYRGAAFAGETWRIRNVGEKPLALSNLREEGAPPVVAVGYEQGELASGEEGDLHIVRAARPAGAP